MADANRAITANFTPSDVYYSISTVLEPSSGGSVRLDPEQPSDGYPVNENVTVFAVPQTGYVFSLWTGDLRGKTNPRTILVSGDKAITAIFNPTVTTYCSPSAGGSVVLDPAHSSNGYDAGTEVTISAKPAKGYRFVGWDGDLSGSAKSVTITVNEAKTTTAKFAEESASRWWLWVILSVGGLFGALILVRLVYARMNRGALDAPQQPDE
jgi:uncharacterized repeat protein (TIGR02543 family)